MQGSNLAALLPLYPCRHEMKLTVTSLSSLVIHFLKHGLMAKHKKFREQVLDLCYTAKLTCALLQFYLALRYPVCFKVTEIVVLNLVRDACQM